MAKILVAEGNLKLRQLMKAMIETKAGWHVVEAIDGHEAVAKNLDLKPDLVVLDFSLAGLNGLQAAAKISAACPGLPIILHTFHGFPAMISEAKKVGIREVLGKGESGERLLDAIDKLLKEKPSTLDAVPPAEGSHDADAVDEPPKAN